MNLIQVQDVKSGSVKRAACGLLALLLMAQCVSAQYYGQATSSTPNVGAPVWTQIEQAGEAVSYFLYNSFPISCGTPGYSCEMPGSTTGPRPELNFFWQQGTTQRTTCARVDYPSESIYWPGEEGSYRLPPPSNYTVSQQAPNPTKGFTVQGNAFGAASGGRPLAITYFTNKPCSDGNVEYGFGRDMTNGSILFYYSTKTNCYSVDCRAVNDINGATQNQYDGPNWPTITNLQASSQSPLLYFFSAYLVPDDNPAKTAQWPCATAYKFRVQIVDGYNSSTLAQCSINGVAGWCGYDLEIQTLQRGDNPSLTERFPDCTIQTGPAYIVTGVTQDYSPNPVWQPIPTYFNVKGVYMGY